MNRWRTSRKSKTHTRGWKRDPFQFTIVLFWCSRCNISYIL